MSDDLSDRIAALYQADPASFVPERNALAKALRGDGDRDAATDVAKLRRPSPAAWGLNLLAGHHPELIDAVIEAGTRWQAAATTGDRSATQEAQADLRRATGDALGAVAELMDERGRPVRTAETEVIRATLQAAVGDDDLGTLLLSGTLEEPSRGSGFAGGFSAGPTLRLVRSPRTDDERTPKAEAGRSKRSAASAADKAQQAAENKALAAREKAEREEGARLAAERKRLDGDARQLEAQARKLAARAERAEEIAAEAAHDAAAAREAAETATSEATAARALVPPP